MARDEHLRSGGKKDMRPESALLEGGGKVEKGGKRVERWEGERKGQTL